jgi:hypothetical protein
VACESDAEFEAALAAAAAADVVVLLLGIDTATVDMVRVRCALVLGGCGALVLNGALSFPSRGWQQRQQSAHRCIVCDTQSGFA